MGWPELLAHVRRRRGIVTVGDAAEHGVPPGAFHRRARLEAWTRLHPGVWLVSGAPDTHDARLVAAITAVDGIARGRSALWLHGLVDEPPHPPQVVVPHGRHGTLRAGTLDVRRSRRLRPKHCTSVRGYPTLRLPETILDVAHEFGRRRTRRLVLDAERRGVLDRADLAGVAEQLGRGVPGTAVLRWVLDDLGALSSDSDTEHDLRRALTDLGYPVHPTPFPFRCRDQVVVELDLALPDHWVYLEVDGFTDHARRPTFETDRVKWTQLVADWRPVWVTARRWRSDRSGVLADLDAAIAEADPTRPPAVAAPRRRR